MPRPAMRTFLFSDVRDYTLFVETRGDDAATKMIRASRRIIRAEVARHRGAAIKTEGDSFYVVFRSPSAALRCAIAIQRAAATHNERHPGLPVHLGIGINTGEAVPYDKGYVGSAVVVAQRLTASALAGQILVTDTVRSLVRTGAHAPMRELGAWTLKGISQPIRVYEVDAHPGTAGRALGPALTLPALLVAPPAKASGLVVCPELVQRGPQLATLLEHLAAAAKGESRIVALTGEGGIGKSRLCRELAQLAHRDGFYVLAGRAHGTGANPYEPIVAALRPYADARGPEVLRRMLGTLMTELRRLLPELELKGPDEAATLPDGERRERFFRTVQLLLEDAASLRPVLLILEDMHDADAATHELLRYLAGSLRAGLCVVMTYREEDVPLGHPLATVLTQLDRDRRLARLRLAPLDQAGVARMTAAMLPNGGGDTLARAIFERSEGVPYYVEELLKTALDDPAATPDHLPLPRTVRDSVQLRVGRLVEQRGQPIAELLEAVAVAAIPLGYAVILKLSPRKDEHEAAMDIAACVESQLLERTATRSEIYQFRHALTREAIAAAIPPPRSRRLHLRVAEALEALGPLGTRPALLARHFAAAGDRGRAVRYGRAGAAAAIQIGAYATAIELLEETAEQARGNADELDVLEELAAALQAAGRANEAEAALGRARELAGEDATIAARLDVRLANVLRMQGRRAEAIAAATRAAGSLEGTPAEALAESLVTLASLWWAENDARRAAELAERALAIAEERAAGRTLVTALTIQGAALARLGALEGIEKLRTAIRLATAEQLGVEAVEGYFELSRALLLRGLGEEARGAAETGLALARERGLEFLQARLLTQLVRLRVNEGRYREAQALAEQAVALARPGTIAAGAAKMALANVLIAQGDSLGGLAILDQIEPHIERNYPDRRMIFFTYKTEAFVGLGRLDEAKAAAEEAIRLTLASPGQGVSAFVQATEVAEARRDAEWARSLAATFEAYFAGRDTGGIRAVRAELDAVLTLCDGGDPAPHFERAAAEYEALGSKHRGMYRRASALVPQLAEPALEEEARREILPLRSYLEEWGAMRFVAVIDRALARPPTPRTAASPLLSADELRVATLVARGLTDARIAAELEASTAQASRLVKRVLRKLGVESRSQVASWVVDRGVLEEASS